MEFKMNLGVVVVLLKSFCAPFVLELERCYDSPDERLEAVREAAMLQSNEEILEICDWVEKNKLATTLFPD